MATSMGMATWAWLGMGTECWVWLLSAGHGYLDLGMGTKSWALHPVSLDMLFDQGQYQETFMDQVIGEVPSWLILGGRG